MKILKLLGFLVLLTTNPITNGNPGQFNVKPVPIYLPTPVAGSSSFGSNFGVIALAIIVLSALFQPVSMPSKKIETDFDCPTGYTAYSGDCDKFCYRFETFNCKSWSDARASCQIHGADLWVPDECSYSHFQGLAKENAAKCKSFWIGGFRVSPTNDYMTLSRAALPVNFKFWALGQPDRALGNPGVEACVQMSNEFNYLMSDDICLDLEGYLCRRNI